MKNAREKFAALARVMAVPAESNEPEGQQDVQINRTTSKQKAVKSASQQPKAAMRLAPVPEPREPTPPQEADESAGEPRRQMTVKLPISLYQRLSNERSKRVVAKNRNWSFQDIISEALERHLRTN